MNAKNEYKKLLQEIKENEKIQYVEEMECKPQQNEPFCWHLDCSFTFPVDSLTFFE